MAVLKPSQIDSIRALGDILIPAGGTLELSASEAGVPERIASWIDRSPPAAQRRFRFLVGAWDLGPVTSPRLRKPFHKLDSEQQSKWVATTHHSKRLDRRAPVTYLKQMIYLAYASSPGIEQAIGYDYTCRLDAEPHARLEE